MNSNFAAAVVSLMAPRDDKPVMIGFPPSVAEKISGFPACQKNSKGFLRNFFILYLQIHLLEFQKDTLQINFFTMKQQTTTKNPSFSRVSRFNLKIPGFPGCVATLGIVMHLCGGGGREPLAQIRRGSHTQGVSEAQCWALVHKHTWQVNV